MATLRPSDEGKFFVHHHRTGQKGWLVDKDDAERLVMPPYKDNQVAVRLDRPAQVILKRYSPGEWLPLATAHPISEMAKAKICYAALRELAIAVGDYEAGKKEFAALREEKRIAFMHEGPKALDEKAADDVRQRIWEDLMKRLS